MERVFAAFLRRQTPAFLTVKKAKFTPNLLKRSFESWMEESSFMHDRLYKLFKQNGINIIWFFLILFLLLFEIVHLATMHHNRLTRYKQRIFVSHKRSFQLSVENKGGE